MAVKGDLNLKRIADAIQRITRDPRFFDLTPKQLRRAAIVQANLAKINTNLAVIRAMEASLESGTGFKGFKEGLNRTTLNNYTKSQLRTAYQTTLQSAFNQGARERALEVKDDRPYWIYDAIDDGATRPSHAALDGIVRRADDPFWSTHLPPNGFNCRCTFNTATEAEAKAQRESEGKSGLQTTTRELQSIKKKGGRPDTGFTRKQTVQTLDKALLKTLDKRIKKLPPALRKSIRNDIKKTERRVNRWYAGESSAFGDKI